MSEGREQGDERRRIARRVKKIERYCSGDVLSLEGLQEKIVGIPADVVLGSEVHFIHRACENERVTLEIVECLLVAFPDAARTCDRDGWSPLHYACWNNNLDPGIVRLLLEGWPESVNHRNNRGDLPLHILCETGGGSVDETASLAVLELLLNAAPDSATTVASGGDLPIHIASMSGKPFLFCKRLIDAYPESVRVRTGDGLLPIHGACFGGEIETVKYMIELYPESIDARSTRGNLPIHCAARSDRDHKADIIRYLLVKDPDCASKTGSDQQLLPPLHSACRRKCLDSVRLLFDAYPEAINIRDREGRTPIDIARGSDVVFQRAHARETPLDDTREPELRGFLEAQLAYARLAEDATAMTTPDQHGWLPLHRALLTGACLGAIKLLIAGNPSALQVAVNQLAFPLHIACEFSTACVVEYLLGLSENDLQKDSTLHYAIRGGNLGAVKCLLEKGVPSVSEPDSDGKLPVQLLWESDRVDRDSVEYVEANWRFLLAYPETLMH